MRNLKISDSQSTLMYLVIWVRCNLEHSMNLTIFWGSAGPQPLRISQSLSMAEFSVKSTALKGVGSLLTDLLLNRP